MLKILDYQNEGSQLPWGWLKAFQSKAFGLKIHMLFQEGKRNKEFGMLLWNLHVLPFSLHTCNDEVMKTLSEVSKKYPHSIPLLPSTSQTLDSATEFCVILAFVKCSLIDNTPYKKTSYLSFSGYCSFQTRESKRIENFA